MKIGLFIKEELEESDIATFLISKINEHGFDFDNDSPDAVIYVGGDGTFLRAVHEYIDNIENIIFVGVNEGTVGYYPHFVIDEIDGVLAMLLSGDYDIDPHHLIVARLGNEELYAVNELRIENPFHTLICNVLVNGVFLEEYRGNGLSICTSSGSGAYNRSLGGAIISPKLHTLQLTEIASINNYRYRSLNSSLVVSKQEEISVEGDFSEAVIGYDHLTTSSDFNRISFSLSDRVVNVVRKEGYQYIDKIRDTFIK